MASTSPEPSFFDSADITRVRRRNRWARAFFRRPFMTSTWQFATTRVTLRMVCECSSQRALLERTSDRRAERVGYSELPRSSGTASFRVALERWGKIALPNP